MDNYKQILTLREIAEYLGVHTSTIYKYAQNGQIPAFKIGSDWRFFKEDIDVWLKNKDEFIYTETEEEIKVPKDAKESKQTPAGLSKKIKTQNEIAVIGMSCRYPGANSLKELWENILAKRVQFRRILDQRLPLSEYFDADPKAPDKIYATKSAVIDGFEFDWSKLRIPKKTFESSDIAHWLALDTALRAFEDAGYTQNDIPIQNTGVILGNTLTGEQTRSQTMRMRWPYVRKVLNATIEGSGLSSGDRDRLAASMEKVYKSAFYPITEDSLAGGLANTIAGRICNYLNFKGGGYIVDGACSSSLLAVATAADALKMGNLDLALAGGVDISLDPFELVGFSKAGALAKDHMRVYDQRANGFVPGEGCGFVLLKRLEDAVRDKDYIYAVIKGWGISSDGKGGIMEPSVSGQAYAIKRAYKSTDYGVHECQFVEGHGTGTTKGDKVELEGIATAIRDSLGRENGRRCGVTSFKSIVGHTKAAAGIGGLIKAVLAVNQRILPPTASCQEPSEVFDTTATSLYPITHGIVCAKNKIIRGGVSSAGFGGINCHITLESKDKPAAKVAPEIDINQLFSTEQQTEVFAFASRSAVHLQKVIKKFKEDLRNVSYAEMADLAARLNKKVRAHASIKVALVTDTPEHLYEALCKIEDELESKTLSKGKVKKIPSGNPFTHILISSSVKDSRIGFLYPGQASQKLNMTRMIVDRYRWASDILEKADVPIKEFILNPKGKYLKDQDKQRLSERLAQTQITQPAVSFSSLIWSEFLSKMGIEPDSVAGHSLGEISAFYKAGAFKKEALMKFAQFRGEVMAAGNGSAAMASLACSHSRAKELVESANGNVVIANINSPVQIVISGERSEVDNVVASAKKAAITARELPVSNAFHSRYMQEAAGRIKENDILPDSYKTNGMKLYSCVDGQMVKGRVDLKEYFSKQVLSPVNFVELVKEMSKDCGLLIEVGPGRVLSDLVKAINKKSGPDCLPVEGTPENDRDMNIVLAELFVRNRAVNWGELYSCRLIRPFVPASRKKFITNQCEHPLKELENLPRLSGELVEAEAETDWSPAAGAVDAEEAEIAAPAHTGKVADILMDLAHTITGYDRESITFDLKLLDDLNLDSIKAAELIAEATKQLGIAGEIDPSQFANSTLDQIRKQLETLRKDRKSGAEEPGAPLLKDSTWVRNFVVEYEKQSIKNSDPEILKRIKKAVVLVDDGEVSVARAIRRGLKTKEKARILHYEDIEEKEFNEFADADCVIAVLPCAEEKAFGRKNLKSILTRLQKIAAFTTRNVANKEVVFVQFGGGTFGENNFQGIEACSAKSFASTLHMERPNLRVKAVDFDQNTDEPDVAERVSAELQSADHFAAAGYDAKLVRRVPVYQKSEPALYRGRGIEWSSDDVILVTGGAKGITAECALELARSTKARIILTGRSLLPENRDDPSNELIRTLNRFKSEKLKARYYSCDVTDSRDVAKLIRDIKKKYGKITGFVHGAGLNQLKRLDQADADEAVKESLPKVIGAVNVCEALNGEPLKLVAGITSIIGVTGMAGSGWYGVANEVLNLYLSRFKKLNTGVNVTSLAYSIWGEVGMGVRMGSVRLLKRKGIHAIPVEEGVKRFKNLIESDSGHQQTIVTANITGVDTWHSPRVERNELRFVENIEYMLPGVELTAGAHLNVKDDSYLLDHNWKGSLLFPLVFGLEAMVQAAAYCSGTYDFKGLRITDVHLDKPIPVNQDTGTDIKIHAEILEKEKQGGTMKAKAQVFSEQDNFHTPYFSANIEFLEREEKPKKAEASWKNKFKKPLDIDPKLDLYGSILFQGKIFQCMKNIYDLFYKEDTGKGECCFDAKYNDGTPKFLKESKKYSGTLLTGDPFFLDVMLQSMQLIVAQDACLPNYIGEIVLFSNINKSDSLPGLSTIQKVDSSRYMGIAHAEMKPGTLIQVNECIIKIIESLPDNPKANDLKEPLDRDKSILKHLINKQERELGIKLPHVEICHIPMISEKSKKNRRELECNFLQASIENYCRKINSKDKFVVKWENSGKPYAESANNKRLNLSLSHEGGTVILVIGEFAQAVDMQLVEERSVDDWRALLGNKKFNLIKGYALDDFNYKATAVWASSETFVKANQKNEYKNFKIEKMSEKDFYIFNIDNNFYINMIIRLSRGGDRVISILLKDVGAVKETQLNAKLGFEEHYFHFFADYSGPKRQLVTIKKFPVTFKNNKLMSRRVYFSSYFDWMGEIREYALLPVYREFADIIETKEWGFATNNVELDVKGELRGSDIVEGRMWLEKKLNDNVYDLNYEFRKIVDGIAKERVALASQRISWIKILTHGKAKVNKLPEFLDDIMRKMEPRSSRVSKGKTFDELFTRKTFNFKSLLCDYSKSLPVLHKMRLMTTLEESNLVGNIYFANYSVWVGRITDTYFYDIYPKMFKEYNFNHEFVCTRCKIDHLNEAMPFDQINIVLRLSKLYSNGIDLNYEIYNGKNQKLAVANLSFLWVKRDKELNPSTINIPKDLVDNIINKIQC